MSVTTVPKKGYKEVVFFPKTKKMVTEDWKVIKFKVLISKIKRGPSKSANVIGKGFIYITSDFLDEHGNLEINEMKCLEKEKIQNLQSCLLEKNDLILNCVNSFEQIGKVAVYDLNKKNIIVGFNNYGITLNDKINAIFVKNLFLLNWYKWIFRSISKVAINQVSFSTKDIQLLDIPVPPLPEQQQIASILSNVDNLIQNTDKLIEKTIRLKKGLMQELLTKGIGHTKFKKITLVPRYLQIQIPNVWNLSTVDSLTINHNSGIFKNKEFYGTGDNIVGVSDLYQHTKIDGQIFKLVRLTDEEKKNKILEEGDLIYGESSLVRTGIGKTLIVTKNGKGTIFAWHTRRIKLKREFSPNFIYYMLDSPLIRNSIVNRATTTALTGITTKDFFGTRIPIPHLPEQQKIASILSNTDEKIQSYERYKEKLQRLKKSLMQKLLTGEVRVTV